MFTDRLFPTNRSNECPMCGNHSGGCRTKDNDEQAVLCSGTPDARKFDREGLYICVNDKAKGHTPHIWVLAKDDTWDDAAQARYHLEKCLRLERTIKAKQEALEKELGLPDRDKYHRAIQSQLSLSPAHKKHLLDRGLYEDQIETIGFVSVTKFQKLKGTFPDNLPGYNTSSKNLTNFKDGILIPIFQENKIAAFKIRLDEANDGQRYTSLSSQKYTSFHLYGESPLVVLHGDKNKGLWLCEGELKPLVANQKFNIAILGGAKYWQNSPNHCSKFLARFKEIYGNRLNIALDAGDILNQQVMNQIISEYKFFESQGFDVCFVWWQQTTKEDNDIDELDNLDNIEFIKLDKLDEIINENRSKALDDISWKSWLKAKKYTATKGFQFESKDFKLPAKTPKKNAIVGIRSGLGTGKTIAMILEMIANEKDHKVKSLLIGYLNNLLRQTENRASKEGLKLLHLNALDIVSPEDNLSFCIHSAHKDDIDYVDKDVYFDEAESTFSTIINGGNLNYYEQERAMKTIEHIVNVANRVFLVDANLTDDLVDFFASLDQSGKQVIKIENTQKIAPHKIIIADGIEKIEVDGQEVKYKLKPKAKSHLIKLLSEPGTVPIVASDSMKFCHALGEELRLKGKNGIIISSKTVGEDYAKKFLDDPNDWIRKNKPDFVIVSPSCNSGISITEPYFNAKFSFFGGVLTTDSQNQFMFRYRLSEIKLSDDLEEKIIHYVYCPENSNVHDHTMPKSYAPKSILKSLETRFNQTFLMSLDIANDQEKAKDHITKTIADKLANPWMTITTKRWASENYERWNLRKCLVHKLRQDGHDVSLIEEEINNEIEEEMKEIKQHLIEKEATALVQSPVLSEEELAKVEKVDHSEVMQLKIKKSRMFIKRLPGIGDHAAYKDFSQLFWEKVIGEQDYISSHQHFSRLINFEDNKRLHNNLMYKSTTAEYFFIGSLRGIDYSKIDTLHKLNFEQFLELGREWHKESPELIEFVEQIIKDRKLQISLGVEGIKEQKNNRERIDLLKKFWEYLGIEPAKAKKRLVDKKRLHCYEIDIDAYNHPLRLMIVELTQAKDKAQILRDSEIVDWKEKTFNGMVNALSDGLLNISNQDDVMAINSYFVKANELPQNDDHKQEVNKYREVCKKAINVAAAQLIEKYKSVTSYNQYEWLNYNLSVTSRRLIGANDSQGIFAALDQIVALANQQIDPKDLQRIKDLRPLDDKYMKMIDDVILKVREYPQALFDSLKAATKWQLRLETAITFGKQFALQVFNDFLMVGFDRVNNPFDSLDDDIQAYYVNLA